MQKLNNPWLGHFALVIWAILNVYNHWNLWSWDASALYFGAYFYDLGQFGLVYSPQPTFFWGENAPAQWVELAQSQGAVGDMSPYVYPPIWAAVLAPFVAKVTALEFFNLFRIVNTGAIVGSVYLAHGLIRPQRVAFSIWALVSIAVFQVTTIGQLSVELNQPQILVTFLMIAAFFNLSRDRDALSGSILALAAAIKIAPAMLAVIFIMERRWKALAVFTGVGLALLAASYALAGADLHQALLVRLRNLGDQVMVSPIVVGLEPVLLQAQNWFTANPDFTFGDYLSVPEPVWISLTTKLCLLAGLALSYVTTRGLPDDLRIWFRLLLVFLITLLTGPLAWVHYLILPLFMLPGLITLARPTVAWAVIVAFSVVFSGRVFVALFAYSWGANAQVFLSFTAVVGLIGVLFVIARGLQKAT